MNGRLYRSRYERVIAGVAGGLAENLGLDPSLVRVVWVILALFSGGAFLIVYIVMAVVVPEEPWMPIPPPSPAPAGTENAATAASGDAGNAASTGAPAPPAQSPWQAQGWGAQGWNAQGWDAQRSAWHAQRDAWRAQRDAERAARRAAGDTGGQGAGLVFGLILLAVGLVFLLPLVVPSLDVGRLWPLVLVGIGLVLVIAALRPGRPPGT